MRILAAVAEYPTEPAVHPLTVASLAALRAPASDGKLVTWRMGGDAPGLTHYENLCAKHNLARQRVLDEGFDALLSVEADMVIPPDALERLAAVDADVAYGLYVSRRVYMWLLFEKITAKGGESIAATPDRAAALWGQVIPSAGAGFGCTLIHRRVLERIEFRLAPEAPFADDWPFALDVAAAGFRQAHDTAVVCGHVVRDGLVVWPAIDKNERGEWVLHRLEETGTATMSDRRSLGRYLVLRTLYLPSQQRYVRPGEIVELGEDAGRLLMRKAAVTPAAADVIPSPPRAGTQRKRRGQRSRVADRPKPSERHGEEK